MMLLNKYIALVIVTLFAFGCKTGKLSLSEDNVFDLEYYSPEGSSAKAKPLLTYNNGIINDFSTDGIGAWHGSDKIFVSKRSGALLVEAKDVGREYDRFVCRLSPLRDFSEEAILKVRVKVEDDNSTPVLRMDIKDSKGYGSNHGDIRMRLVNSGEYVDYYFDYTNKNKQSYPFWHDIDKTSIAELEFFINPGGSQYTGRFYIEKIVAVKRSELEKEMMKSSNNVNNIIKIDDVVSDIKYWGSNNAKYELSYKDSNIVVKSYGPGKRYESFGCSFTRTDVGKTPIIKVTAKVQGEASSQLRIDLIDCDGRPTNGQAIVKTVPNDDKFRDYYFDYTGKLYQGWPETGPVKSDKIGDLMWFLDPGDAGFFGTLIISDVKLMPSEGFNKEFVKSSLSKSDSKEIAIYSNNTDVYSWWSSDYKNLTVGRVSENLEINSQVKVDSGIIGNGFDVIDFTKYPIVKVIAKNETNSELDLRIRMNDTRGYMTNNEDVETKISADGKFVEYYFDFTNKFKQKTPEENYVDPKLVSGISLYVNPEKGGFIGTLKIKEISAINSK